MIKQITKPFIWTWEKLKRAGRWIKRNFLKVVIGTTLTVTAAGVGTQTTLLNTSPINYPLTANTNVEKLEYLYRAHEMLNLENNTKWEEVERGNMTMEEWRNYIKNDYRPKRNWIGWAESVIGEQVPDIIIGEIATSTGGMVDVKISARQFYKKEAKKSVWEINLNTILKMEHSAVIKSLE